jgi:large subunit ribosomal protein L35
MPKIKTKRGAAKRFKVTGTGRVRRRRAYHSHILTSKNRKKKRHLSQGAMIEKVDQAGVKRLIPYL